MDGKKLALTAFRHCFNSDYRLIRRLLIFDGVYYLKRLGVTDTPISDPIWHYLRNSNFAAIQESLPRDGWRQCPDPHPLFDSAFYVTFNRLASDVTGSEIPLSHYLRKGWKEGLLPGPYFDPEVYEGRTDWDENKGDPLTHYSHHGKFLGISPGLHFDLDFYLDRNPVLANVGSEIIRHYKLHGAKIGKSPLPVFDPPYYLQQLEDQEYASQDPLAHYLTTVQNAVPPAAWFDPVFYARQYKKTDRAVSVRNAFVHYVTHGVYKGSCTTESVNTLKNKPLISIVVPVYNPDLYFLANCIRSVLYQAYPHWELCLADDCSTKEGVRETLLAWAKKDSRIKVTRLKQNSGISAATNAALALAGGEYVGFLDNDDELTVDALYWVAHCIGHKGAELMYSDEDLIGDDGSRFSLFRKPGFNRELLLSHNYITHFVAVKKKLLDEVGGLNSTFDGAQDYDLMLKLTEKTDKIHHLPKVLYHWRASETSTSINHDQKDYAHEAGKGALRAALERRGIVAQVEDSGLNYFYRLSHKLERKERVAIFIRADEDWSAYCDGLVALISATSTPEVTFVIVTEPEIFSPLLKYLNNQLQDTMVERDTLDVMHHPVKPGTSAAEGLHQAIMSAECEYLGFIDPRLQKITADWLDQMLGCLQPSDISLVNGRVQFDGSDGRSMSLPELSDEAVDYYLQFLQYHTRHLNGAHCLQEVPCCGAEITVLKKHSYTRMGGFDFNRYPTLFFMADFALRLRAQGERICFTPFAVGDFGAESENHKIIQDDVAAREEKERFQMNWKKELETISKYYAPAVLEDAGIDRERFLRWFTG